MSKYIPISNSPTLQSNQKDAIMTQIDLVMTSQNQTNDGESNQLSNISLKLPAGAKGQLLQNILLCSTQLPSEFRKEQNSASNNKSSHPNKVKIFGNKQNTQHLTNTWPNSYASFSSLHYNLKNAPLIWKVERPTPAAVDGPPPTALEAAVIWRPSKNNMSKYIPISERLPHAKATYVGGEPPTAAVGGPPPAALEAVVVWRPKRPAHAKTIYEVGELTPAAVNEPPPAALEAAVEWKPNRNDISKYIPFVNLSKELNFVGTKCIFGKNTFEIQLQENSGSYLKFYTSQISSSCHFTWNSRIPRSR